MIGKSADNALQYEILSLNCQTSTKRREHGTSTALSISIENREKRSPRQRTNPDCVLDNFVRMEFDMGGQPRPNDPFPSGAYSCWPAGAEEEPICKSGKALSNERRLPCWDLGESGCFEAMVMVTDS